MGLFLRTLQNATRGLNSKDSEPTDTPAKGLACSFAQVDASYLRKLGRLYRSKKNTGIALAERNATPQEESAILRDLAQALIDDGALNLGQGYSLVSKLDMIDGQLADRDIEAAVELFQAFIDQVQTFVSAGTLPVAQGPPLIDAAQNAI